MNPDNEQNVPSSWNYGSFHLQSRLYTSFLQKDVDTSAVVHQKYEPLTNSKYEVTSKVNSRLPPQESSKLNHLRGRRADESNSHLKMNKFEQRKASTSTGWQRTSKSVECPKNKIASEDYYRALKAQKEVSSNAKQLELMNHKAMSFLLAGKSPLVIFRLAHTSESNYGG